MTANLLDPTPEEIERAMNPTPEDIRKDRELRACYEAWQAAIGTPEEKQREEDFAAFVRKEYP
jgi:hypothetical protein